MSTNATFPNGTTPPECPIYTFLGGKFDKNNSETYAVLVFIIVLAIIASPVTTFLNAFVIYAVKTKPRLQTMSNIAIGCLAVTDGLTGIIGLPTFIAARILTLKAETSSDFCAVKTLSRNIIRILCGATMLHLLVMNVERHIALKYSFSYLTIVTKGRIIGLSFLAWITTFILTVPLAVTDESIYLTVNNSILFFSMVFIFSCEVIVYCEARRHQKQIAAQQVSVEARKTFLAQKKVSKVTTSVLLALVITYTPIFLVRILVKNSVIRSTNAAGVVFFTATLVIMLNSLINPIIYCVRKRQFRESFLEIFLGKTIVHGEEIQMGVIKEKSNAKFTSAASINNKNENNSNKR